MINTDENKMFILNAENNEMEARIKGISFDMTLKGFDKAYLNLVKNNDGSEVYFLNIAEQCANLLGLIMTTGEHISDISNKLRDFVKTEIIPYMPTKKL